MYPRVVVDTTEIFRAPNLDSLGWPELLARCRRGQVSVFVPEVVMREASRHVRERLQGDLDRARNAMASLRDLGVITTPDLRPTADEAVELAKSYRARLDQRLQEHSASVLPVPQTPHSDILDRDLDVRKPFQRSGKGYRDALVWETVMEVVDDCNPGDIVYFVTTNTRDYCDPGENGLAEELRHEVSAVARDVTVIRADSVARLLLDEALRDHFTQGDERDWTFDLLYGEPTLSDIVADSLASATEQLIGSAFIDSTDLKEGTNAALISEDVVPPEMFDVDVTAVETDLDSLELSVYDEYEGDTLSLRGAIEASIEFAGFVDSSGFYDYEVIDDDLDDDESEEAPDERRQRVDSCRRVRLWFDLLVVGTQIDSIKFDYAEAA